MVSRLLLTYHGAGFHGWSRQPGLRTVQGALEEALYRARGKAAKLTVAGRTDAGVHACGQVASHPGEPASADRLNALLCSDVRVLESELADEGFDARRDAKSRLYRYRVATGAEQSPLERGRAFHTRRPLSFSALSECADAVCGTHDFRAFTPAKTDHVRFERDVFWAQWRTPSETTWEFWIEADTFMRHMVRTLVGTMLEVSTGRRSLANFVSLLEGGCRCEAAATAPPHGLCLMEVSY